MSQHSSSLCSNQYFPFTTDDFLALGPPLWALSCFIPSSRSGAPNQIRLQQRIPNWSQWRQRDEFPPELLFPTLSCLSHSFSALPLVSLWFGNYFICSLPQLPYNLKRKSSISVSLPIELLEIRGWGAQTKWKINVFPSQFRAQQKKGSKIFYKILEGANGTFQFKLELYFGIPRGEIGILPHCNSLIL